MRFLVLPLIIVLNFIFQSTIFQSLSIGNVVPNTSLIIIISFALLKGKKVGSSLGLCIGLLQDVIFSEVIGINALIFFLIGYMVGLVDNKLFKENIWIILLLTLIATFVFHFLLYTLMYFLGYEISFMIMFKKVIALELLFNIILSVPIYKGIKKMFKSPKLSFRG